MYERELQTLGLSEKEAKVYLSALELGASTVQNIAKKSGVNRATTYVQIESLKEKGLVSEFEKGKKTFYVAESPERLQSLFKIFETELDFRKSELQRILPTMLELFAGMGERPKVRFFEGREGIHLMREDVAKLKVKQIYSIINRDKVKQFAPDFKEEYINHRIEKKIPIQVIYTRESGGPDSTEKDAAEYRQSKFIPFDKFPIKADITIYDDKVILEGYGKKVIGIVIESEAIAVTFKAIFLNLWEKL